MTHVMAAVRCLKCTTMMLRQGGRIYYCSTCHTFYRLKGMVPVCEKATLQDAQRAIAKDIAEEGLMEVVG